MEELLVEEFKELLVFEVVCCGVVDGYWWRRRWWWNWNRDRLRFRRDIESIITCIVAILRDPCDKLIAKGIVDYFLAYYLTIW